MNFKQVLSGLILLAVAVAAFFLLKNKHGSEAADASDEQVATVVTVQTGQVKRKTLCGYIEEFASVQPATATEGRPAALARVTPAVAGVITEVKITQGQHIDAGAVLFQFDTRVADVAVDFAKKALERQQRLLQSGNTSQKAVQDAEQVLATAEAQRVLLSVKAPLSGTVTHVNVAPGEAVDPSMTLAEIADLNRLDVTAEIPSGQAGLLQLGQTMELLAEPPATTSLSFISPVVNPTNDTLQVRAALPADSSLRSGQSIRIRIVTAVHMNCLTVPTESVVADTNGQSVVAIVTGEDAAQVPVKTGLRDGPLVEVEGNGVKEGDAVVTVGAYGLPEKTKVHVTNP